MDRMRESGHDQFADEVAAWMRDDGWTVPRSMTYHDVFDRKDAALLGARSDPTSCSIRGGADLVGIRPDLELSIRVECKTIGTRHRNFACAVFPFCEHLVRSRLGCRTVYAVRHDADGRQYGFRVGLSVLDVVDAVYVPCRYRDAEMSDLVRRLKPILGGGVDFIRKPDPLRGSGIPYLLIRSERLDYFTDWRDVIDQETRTGKGLQNATDSHDQAGVLD